MQNQSKTVPVTGVVSREQKIFCYFFTINMYDDIEKHTLMEYITLCFDKRSMKGLSMKVFRDMCIAILLGVVGAAIVVWGADITVDAATGNVKTAEYDVQWTINFDDVGAIIPLGTRSSYAVTF